MLVAGHLARSGVDAHAARTLRISPVAGLERVVALDVLRGFALLGVLAVNVREHLGPPANFTDSVISLVVRTLANGKFYPLFTFLFAIGCAMQAERFNVAARPWLIYVRRALSLYVMGAVLFVFVDDQAILLEYAILAPILWALSAAPLRMVAAVAGSSFVLVVTSSVLESPAQQRDGPTREQLSVSLGVNGAQLGEIPVEDRRTWHAARRGRPYAAWVQERIGSYWRDWPTAARLDHFLHLFCIGCLGVYAFRRGLIRRALLNDRVLRRLVWRSLGIGLPLSVLIALGGGVPLNLLAAGTAGLVVAQALNDAIWFVAGPALALSYAAAIARSLNRLSDDRWGMRLAAAGRMAFTNFVVQSLVMTTMFYGYGAGLEGRIGPALGALLVIAVWLVQVWASGLWIRHFRFGPIEWLWRTATYATVQPLRQVQPRSRPVAEAPA